MFFVLILSFFGCGQSDTGNAQSEADKVQDGDRAETKENNTKEQIKEKQSIDKQASGNS